MTCHCPIIKVILSILVCILRQIIGNKIKTNGFFWIFSKNWTTGILTTTKQPNNKQHVLTEGKYLWTINWIINVHKEILPIKLTCQNIHENNIS